MDVPGRSPSFFSKLLADSVIVWFHVNQTVSFAAVQANSLRYKLACVLLLYRCREYQRANDADDTRGDEGNLRRDLP